MIRFFFLVSFFLREAAASKESEREREHLLDRVLRKRQKKVENAYTKDRTSASCDTGLFGGLWGISAETRGTGRRGGRREGRREGGGVEPPPPPLPPLYLSPPSLPSRALKREDHKAFSLPKRFKTRPLTTRACTLAASKKRNDKNEFPGVLQRRREERREKREAGEERKSREKYSFLFTSSASISDAGARRQGGLCEA